LSGTLKSAQDGAPVAEIMSHSRASSGCARGRRIMAERSQRHRQPWTAAEIGKPRMPAKKVVALPTITGLG
jgi:hypothetical protein